MKIKLNFNVIALVVMIIGAVFGVIDASAMCAEGVITPEGGGVVEVNTVQTTQFARENADALLLNDIERKVVKIRPMGNPLEQLARYANKQKVNEVIVQYDSTETIDATATIGTAFTASSTGVEQTKINTSNNDLFSVNETIMIPSIKGYDEGGVSQKGGEDLELFIIGKDTDGQLIVKPVNGVKIGDKTNCVPTLAEGTKLIRAGRAHNEIDIQTSPYACVPTPHTQFLQTFKAQVEESTLMKIADKEVDWAFSDLEEEAVYDMKRGMNKSFWKGAKRRIYDASKKEIYLTGGIWWQAGKTFTYGKSADSLQLDEDMLVDLHKEAFTGNAGSKIKIFLMGSSLMANMSKIQRYKTYAGNGTQVKYGITFSDISTNFGHTWCVLDESLDELGMDRCGLIFDANFLRKKYIKELSAMDLELRKSGAKDVDARTITEISGLVLQNPKAHVKVIPMA